jgi:hypothetical protein
MSYNTHTRISAAMSGDDRTSSTHWLNTQDVFAHWPPDPRQNLNNELQSIYGSSAQEHVRWEVYSQGPPNALIWHATVYSKGFWGVKFVHTNQYVGQLMI